MEYIFLIISSVGAEERELFQKEEVKPMESSMKPTLIANEDFTLLGKNNIPLSRDEAVYLDNQDELEDAISLLTYHFNQCRIRGETLLVEIWSPCPLRKERKFQKQVFR